MQIAKTVLGVMFIFEHSLLRNHMTNPTLLGLSGALRQGSTNTKLLAEAARLFGDATYNLGNLHLPLYDGDIETDQRIVGTITDANNTGGEFRNIVFTFSAGMNSSVNSIRLYFWFKGAAGDRALWAFDEFAVVFWDKGEPRHPGSQHPDNVIGIARRFQKAICEHRYPKLGADAVGQLTVSGGLAGFPWDGQDVDALVAHADAMAIQSKRQGKNVICFGPGCAPVSNGDAPKNE